MMKNMTNFKFKKILESLDTVIYSCWILLVCVIFIKCIQWISLFGMSHVRDKYFYEVLALFWIILITGFRILGKKISEL